MKKENLVQKAQQLENRSASWVGKLCMVRIYFFVHRQRAHARVRFRADMVDGPLSLIKKMSGLINQHAAPSRAAVTCPPNAALQSYAVPPPPCDGSESKKSTTNARLQSDLPQWVARTGGRRGKPARLLQWRKVDPTVTVCVCVLAAKTHFLESLIVVRTSVTGWTLPASHCFGALLYNLLDSPPSRIYSCSADSFYFYFFIFCMCE